MFTSITGNSSEVVFGKKYKVDCLQILAGYILICV
jgi:hypothetical protein